MIDMTGFKGSSDMEFQGSRGSGSLGLGLGQTQRIITDIQRDNNSFLMRTTVTITRVYMITVMKGQADHETLCFAVKLFSKVRKGCSQISVTMRMSFHDLQMQYGMVAHCTEGSIGLVRDVVLRFSRKTMVRCKLILFLSTLRMCRMIFPIFR